MTKEEIIKKYSEDPSRTAFLIKGFEHIDQNGSVFLRDLQLDAPFKISCKSISMLELANFYHKQDNPYLIPTPPGQSRHTIDSKDVLFIDRDGPSLTIFTDKAVYSTVDFSYECERIVDDFRHQRAEIANANRLRSALQSATTFFKSEFKNFCQANNIQYTKVKGLFGPKEELEAIAEKIKETLKAKGIDLETVKSISMEDYKDIIRAAQSIYLDKQRAIEEARAQEALSKLLTFNKPLIYAGSLKLETVDPTLSKNPNAEAKNVIASLEFSGRPLEQQEQILGGRTFFRADHVTIRNITQISDTIYAIETDGAVFVNISNAEEANTLGKCYAKYLTDNGLEISQFYGAEGIQHRIGEYMNGGKSLLDGMRGSNGQTPEKGKVAMCLALCEKEGIDIYYVSTPYDDICLIDANEMMHNTDLERVLPGASIMFHSSDVHPLTQDNEQARGVVTVLDCVFCNGHCTVLTDKGIFTNEKIARELEQAREQLGLGEISQDAPVIGDN